MENPRTRSALTGRARARHSSSSTATGKRSTLDRLFRLFIILAACLTLLAQGLFGASSAAERGRANPRTTSGARSSNAAAQTRRKPAASPTPAPAGRAPVRRDTSRAKRKELRLGAGAVINFRELDEAAMSRRRRPGRTDVPVPQPPADINPPAPRVIQPHGPPGGGVQTAESDPGNPPAPSVLSPPPARTFEAEFDEPVTIGQEESHRIPPDTTGAVGRDKIFVTLNNYYVVLDKATGARLGPPKSIDVFWLGAGAVGVFDPRVQYDPYNDRWLVAAAGKDESTAEPLLLVGVSMTSDPEGEFFLQSFTAGCSPDAPGCTAEGEFADFPMLGFNKNWIAVTTNQLTITSRQFIAGAAFILDYPQFRNRIVKGATIPGLGKCVHPATTYSPTEETLYFVQQSEGTIHYRTATVTGTPSSPQMTLHPFQPRPGGTWMVGLGNILPQTCAPLFGACPSTLTPIESIDHHVRSNVVFRGGRLYYAQTVGFDTDALDPSLDHTAAQWTVLDAVTAAFLDGGRVRDPAATPTNGGKWYAYPSIAANGQGDILLGFSEFESDGYASAGYAFRAAEDAPGTTRAPVVYKSGEDYYQKLSTGGRNRWGDYSHTVVDPSNDLDLWTIQEYAALCTAVGGGDCSLWGTWWAKVAPPPLTPTSLAAQSSLTSLSVTLGWTDNASNEGGFKIERCTGAGCTDFAPLSQTSADVTNFTDDHVTPAATYRYRVFAFNDAGDSDYSNTATATTPSPPAAPSGLAATADGPNRVTLDWTDTSGDETGFIVGRRDEPCGEVVVIGTAAANATSFEDDKVVPGSTYTYLVRASRGSFVSGFSNEVSVKAPDDPNASDTRLASRRAAADAGGNGASTSPVINSDDDSSDDGRYVAFVSTATDLHPGDTQKRADVYVRDVQTGVIELVSVGAGGAASDGVSDSPSISADGRYVVFSSTASTLAPSQDHNQGFRDIFLRDRRECTTRLLSTHATGEALFGHSYSPVISADGAAVAFVSRARLVDKDADKKPDIYAYRLGDDVPSSERLVLVSYDLGCGASADGMSTDPVISADGKYVAFASNSTTISSKDKSSNFDVFRRDITEVCTADSAELISAERTNASSGNGDSFSPVISDDGRRVAFVSTSSNLAAAHLTEDPKPDVFVRIFQGMQETTRLVSIRRDLGGSANGASAGPVISGDGRYVAFTSTGTNLVPLADGKEVDRNDARDVFLLGLDNANATAELISARPDGRSGNGPSNAPFISRNGLFVAFISNSTNLITNVRDRNGANDVFLRDHVNDTTELISVSAPTATPENPPRTTNGVSNAPAVSGAGGFVAFASTGDNVAYNDRDRKPDVFRRRTEQGHGPATRAQPTIQFADPALTVGEADGVATVTVTRDAAFSNAQASVNYSAGGGTATPGPDYAPTSGTLTFGARETSKTFDVPVVNDSLSEGDETVTLTLGGPVGGASLGEQSTLVLTIDDNESPPKLTVEDTSVAEPAGGTSPALFNVRLSAASASTLSLHYETEPGSATAGTDYASASGTLTFAPGETLKQLTVAVNGDALAETTETFKLNLSPSAGVTVADGQGVCDINDSSVLITEFRFRGPSPLALGESDGSLDEFVELYNNSNAPLTVAAHDASAGWALAALNEDGATATALAVIPNGTVIPARGHYLFVNKDVVHNAGRRYSLDAYATGDGFYTPDISDGAGVALFTTSDPANFDAAHRLDAAGFDGFAGGTPGLFREGSGLASVGVYAGEYSFVRRVNLINGAPQDTNDNEADFVLVSTDGGHYGFKQSVLGAPGPQNAAGPGARAVGERVLDPLAAPTLAPNRLRDQTDVREDARFGTLSIRRTFVNQTGGNVTRLRFRVIDITTLRSPNVCGGCVQSDVRVLSRSGSFSVTRTDGTTALVHGTTVEDVSASSGEFGGGLNHTLSTGAISLAAPLPAGASVNVEFLLGVESQGYFRFYVNFEALP